MLSYRHAFHAGNHADVLKHTVLIHCIRHLLKKDKPFQYVDTHAGAGLYDLKGNYADFRKEYLDGIKPLIARTDLPPVLEDYVEIISSFNPTLELEFYPGSPFIAKKLLRHNDQLRLHELHRSDFEILRDHTVSDSRIVLLKKDGLRGMIKAFPPSSRRGLVLIDPSYEIKSDYEVIPFAIDDALSKFAQAMILIWYPMLEDDTYQFLKETLSQVSGDNWLNVEFRVRKEEKGLFGSGMWIINPPWDLPGAIQSIQEILPSLLGEDPYASVDFNYSIP